MSRLACYSASNWHDVACMGRRLGVAQDSSFEEVQDARNYLYEV